MVRYRYAGQPADAAQFVATIERRQGIKIASPDEIAFQRGFISADEFERLISERYPKNDYGRYLRSVLRAHVGRVPA